MEGNANTSSHLETPAQDCIVVKAKPLVDRHEEYHSDGDSEGVSVDLGSSPSSEAVAATTSECHSCRHLQGELTRKDDLMKRAADEILSLRAQRNAARAENGQLVYQNNQLRQAGLMLAAEAAAVAEERLRLVAQLAEQTLRVSELERGRDEARKRAENLEKTLVLLGEEVSYVADKVKDVVRGF